MQSTPNQDLRDEIRAVVKEIIIEIKPHDDGLEDFPDDAPLFDDGEGEPSPVGLDSLDGLDLALNIRERFDLNGDEFDRLFDSKVDVPPFRNVNDIVDFILSAHGASSKKT